MTQFWLGRTMEYGPLEDAVAPAALSRFKYIQPEIVLLTCGGNGAWPGDMALVAGKLSERAPLFAATATVGFSLSSNRMIQPTGMAALAATLHPPRPTPSPPSRPTAQSPAKLVVPPSMNRAAKAAGSGCRRSMRRAVGGVKRS